MAVRLSRSLLDAVSEDHASESFIKATITADMAIRAEAQPTPVTVNASRLAKLASGGLFGLTGVKEDRRAALGELREAVERVRELEGQAARHSPPFGVWQLPEDAREVGETLLKATLSLARLKGLGKGAEGEFVKLSAAAGVGASAFNALGDVKVARAAVEAASAIQRVVEKAWTAVRPVVAIASRALAKAKPAPETVGLADEEFRRAFNVAGNKRPLYFVYSVGDVEYGSVRARRVRAVAFMGGKKTLRIEVLAEGVKGLAKVEKVRTLGREWVRLATFEMEAESGLVQLIPRVEISAQVKVDVKETERRALAWLAALALTDAEKGGERLGSPDPMLHLLYTLAVGEAVVRVKRVMFTETGPTLQLEAKASAERVNWLYEDVVRELDEAGVVVGVRELRLRAKSKAVEAIGEYAGEVKRIAREARGVEELRVKLVQLFDKALRKAAYEYRHTRSEEALWRAVGAAVAKKFFAENVDDPVWWMVLLLGDGVVRPRDHELGFSAVPAKAAEAVMYIFARVMGVPLEVQRGKGTAALTRAASRAAVERLFKWLEEAKVGDASAFQLLTAVAEWWLGIGTGGSDPPKLLSLLALRELTAGKEGRWLRAWLLYEAAVTTMPEAVEQWLNGVHSVSVKPPQEGDIGFDVYFERGGVRFRLHTDFTDFRLFCVACGDEAGSILRAVAEVLGREPRLEGKDSDKKRLVLPAEVGWPMLLRLWKMYNTSLLIKDGDRELLRVEVLDVKSNGEAKFRLWYYKWRETRPHQPYVDVEITYREKWQGFVGYVYANEAEGIRREHLAEITELLERMEVKGVSLRSNGKMLQFSGRFRDSVLRELGVKPELPPGEPSDVEYLGGLRFRVVNKEVEFGNKFDTALKFPSRDEAINLVRSLKAVGVYAEVTGNTVKLDRDAFFGLLAAADTVPPGLTLLYRSEEDDFRVYASAEGSRMRFYFAVKHSGVWKAVGGLYNEKLKGIMLIHTEHEVLEAIRSAVVKALEKLAPEELGRPAEVGKPREKKGEVKKYYLTLYSHNLALLLEHAAEDVRAELAGVRLEGRRIIIETSGVEAAIDFRLLKRGEAEFLLAEDVGQTLAIYKSLKALGVPVEITPKGVKVDSEAVWALVTTAVESHTPSGLSAEVMPNIELLKVYSAGDMKLYAFRVSEEGVYYYFAVRTKEGWKAAGGKYDGKRVFIAGKAARVVADAINTLYREMGVERRVEVKYDKRYDAPYVLFTNEDLRLLGMRQISR